MELATIYKHIACMIQKLFIQVQANNYSKQTNYLYMLGKYPISKVQQESGDGSEMKWASFETEANAVLEYTLVKFLSTITLTIMFRVTIDFVKRVNLIK